ncbi:MULTISPECIES: hypothetical protein [Robertmurraya]|uniref:Uncharacterized protein n=1 Tax=Robertmurraya beringensis TaxID=641660 RepID=A0ABV6KLG7_9BACI|nr:Uncharacterised protein [Mycobacteroides abscessus subsp. abscessus]
MKKNRYLFCLLATGVMLYYGVPELSAYNAGTAGIYSVAWLVLAVFVIAGNLSAIMYAPKKRRVTEAKLSKKQVRRKVRAY